MSPASYAEVYLNDPKSVDLIGIRTNDSDGAKGYYSIAIVKANSKFKSLDDLKGASFSFADPHSTSGFRVPSSQFAKKFGGNMDNQFNGFFKSVGFSGGHEQDVLGVLNGQFDGAVTWASMVGDYNKGYSAGALTRL